MPTPNEQSNAEQIKKSLGACADFVVLTNNSYSSLGEQVCSALSGNSKSSVLSSFFGGNSGGSGNKLLAEEMSSLLSDMQKLGRFFIQQSGKKLTVCNVVMGESELGFETPMQQENKEATKALQDAMKILKDKNPNFDALQKAFESFQQKIDSQKMLTVDTLPSFLQKGAAQQLSGQGPKVNAPPAGWERRKP